MLNTKEYKMENYDWSGFTKEEKKEAWEDLLLEYERLFWHQAQLHNENEWNDYYEVWSHDEARKNIERTKKSILSKEKFWNITKIKGSVN